MTLNYGERLRRLRGALARILIFALCLCVSAITVRAWSLQKEAQLEAAKVSSGETAIELGAAGQHNDAVQEHLPALIETPILFSSIVYSASYDDDVSDKLIATTNAAISELTTAIDSGEYTADATTIMLDELDRLKGVVADVIAEQTVINAWRDEYYYATETWLYLKQHGYSDAVAAGIIGNMMIETSGGSLALNPTIYSSGKGFYGLCQWSLYYRPKVAGMSFEKQLDYLHNDMPSEFATFGSVCYKRGFTFEDFLALEDPATVADAFAKIYERCGSGSYGLRKKAAVKAYEYFTLNIS